MNKIIELKGQFNYSKNPSTGASITLPKNYNNNPVTLLHLNNLYNELIKIKEYYFKDTLINGSLITVYYREIVAKSNRLSRLLETNPNKKEESIRGAKYNKDVTKHIFTYFNSLNDLEKSIDELKETIDIFKNKYKESISLEEFNEIKNNFPSGFNISKSNFMKIIKDAYYVESFDINFLKEDIKDSNLVSLYKVGIESKEILRKLGISLLDTKTLDEDTFFLTLDELRILKEKAPYLIAMKTRDLKDLSLEDISIQSNNQIIDIPSPNEEPVIGVIDTLFDENVYFKEWVEYEDLISDDIPKSSADYFHGTAVTSLIVDGPSFNKELNDNCGRFRVKHFGVALHDKISSFFVLKSIRKVVSLNRDIKVWNLSLGSALEISSNFISIEGYELDKIQNEFDVIFVVAGTNDNHKINQNMKIGAPADSLNSIVVNSVDRKNNPASYSRHGPVLSFFFKPDLSYYGGDKDKLIRVCGPLGEKEVAGTSFAAPWITRKLAFLIYKLNFSREVAKALLIDASCGWNLIKDKECKIGYGVCPIDINDIVSSKNDEIKFIFKGITKEYITSTFNIPIPLDKNNKYPFITRATMCYFTPCLRNQGVDYTNIEVDFKFGRVFQNELKSFNKNTQGDENDITKEESARKNWRKWDNIKHIQAYGISPNNSKKSYQGNLCGVKMTVKNRLSSTHYDIPFGIVITLKEINGINRNLEFINLCYQKGWIVNQIDVENLININLKAMEEIKFD